MIKPLVNSIFVLFFALGLSPSLHATNTAITVIVPWSEQGDTAHTAKFLAPILSKYLNGATIQLKFISGEHGRIGHQALKQAKPDGKTFMLGNSVDAIYAHIMDTRLDSDWHEFEFIEVISIHAMVCVTSLESPYQDYKYFFDTLRKTPKLIRHATYGHSNTLFARFFLNLLGVKYEEITQSITPPNVDHIERLNKGMADFYCGTFISEMKNIAHREVAPIFSNSLRGIDGFQNIPFSRQIGLKGIDRYNFFTVISAPRGTPRGELQKMRLALSKLNQDPEWTKSSYMAHAISGINRIVNVGKFIEEEALFFEKIAIKTNYTQLKSDR